MSQSLSWNQDSEGLVARYLKDPRPDLKDLIMVQYASLVERTARRFAGIEPFEDLVQVGFIGLLNALSRFDPNAGVRFNTYATYLVSGEIKHYLRDHAQTIRHPAWLQELRGKVTKASGMLQQELGHPPTEREIADAIGVSETAVHEVFQTQDLLKVGSLDQPANGQEDEGTSEVDRLDTAAFCPEQMATEDRMVLEKAIAQLRDLEREVLVHFHFDSMSQTEIAAKLGISCNYVSHILRQSLAKLRRILTADEQVGRTLQQQSSSTEYEVIDQATGAYTDHYFFARLDEEIHRSSASESPVGLVMVNFSGLDSMRKFYGEGSVIDFLADAAEFFKGNVRRLDIVARVGETGFGIILPETGPKVNLVRQRLVKTIHDWMANRLTVVSGVSVEVGQGEGPSNGRNAKALVEYALAQAKVEVAEIATRAA